MVAPKFNRNYILSVQIEDGSTLNITLPLSIEFDITRNTLSSSNIAQIRIYNLSQKNRDFIRFDFSNYTSNRMITLRAGYGNNLPIIFVGNITQAWSVREGIDFVTTIESFDAGFAFINGEIPSNVSFPKGTPMKNIYKSLMGYLPNTTYGAIGNSYSIDKDGNPFLSTRSNTYQGNTVEALKRLCPNAFFVDNGKSFILGNNECREGQVALIDSNSGLLGTPLRELNTVTFDMIFEPGVIMGQKIELQSLTNPSFNSNVVNIDPKTKQNVNGLYKIVSIKHRGMISPTICGSAITTLQFFYGPQALATVTNQ